MWIDRPWPRAQESLHYAGTGCVEYCRRVTRICVDNGTRLQVYFPADSFQSSIL